MAVKLTQKRTTAVKAVIKTREAVNNSTFTVKTAEVKVPPNTNLPLGETTPIITIPIINITPRTSIPAVNTVLTLNKAIISRNSNLQAAVATTTAILHLQLPQQRTMRSGKSTTATSSTIRTTITTTNTNITTNITTATEVGTWMCIKGCCQLVILLLCIVY